MRRVHAADGQDPHRREDREYKPGVEIWHNPRCSKCRRALELLTDAGIEPRVRLYLEDPPSAEELDRALTALGLEPWDIARFDEPVAREVGLADLERDRRAWIEVMSANPRLIERPVVIASDGRALVGRPPERVLELV
jgi:arsenate reductase